MGSRLSIPLIRRKSNAFARASYKVVVVKYHSELDKPSLKSDLFLAMDLGQSIRECLFLLIGAPSLLLMMEVILSGMAPEIPS